MPPKSDAEKKAHAFFDKCVTDIVLKYGPHLQKEVVAGLGNGGKRYYTVTIFSRGRGYGGDRTPIVCSDFDSAKQIVEENRGDIWECSYDLCVISAFYLDCMYGVPWVEKEFLGPGIERTYVDDKGETRIYGQAMEEEEYWYVWRGGDDGHYAPCHRPSDFMKGGPVG